MLSRLYIWSIVFQPLLFFVLFQRELFGVPGSLSRILQILVIIGLILRFLIRFIDLKSYKVRVANFTSPLYINFLAYFALLIFAGLIGLASGAYDLPAAYQQGETLSGFSSILNSAEVRPLVEYFIEAYYFIYFSILPKYILKTEKDIIRFFTFFKALFIISFVIGVVDFAFAASHLDLIPRQIMDGVNVGMRYHGLAGEPRQAVGYLALGLAIFHLQAFFEGKKLSRWWMAAIITAILLTQSASAMLGIIAFLGLYIIFNLGNFRKFLIICLASPLVIFLLYVIIINSDRINMYVESTHDLWSILESGGELPYLMKTQLDSIYPLYDLTVKFRDFDFLPVFIGSGLGSASVVNNVYVDSVFGTSNPNSQFVRILYESGLIGMLFFVLAFTYPVKYLSKGINDKTQHQFIIYTLLLVGCMFGVRSLVAYIYLGIFIAAFNVFGQNSYYRNGDAIKVH